VILTPVIPNLFCYFEHFEELTSYIDYMGEYFKLLKNNMDTDIRWEEIEVPSASYISLVYANANTNIIACPVSTTSTVATPTTSSISSSFPATGTAKAVDLEAAIRQLQLLQSNPSLLGGMDDTVRRLVLFLGATTSSSQAPDDTSQGDDTGISTSALAPPTTSREVDRHEYLQERNRRVHLEKRRHKLPAGTITSAKTGP